MAQTIEKAGSNLLDISTGMGDHYEAPDGFPFDDKIYAASLVKRNAGIPVVGVGGITTGAEAEQVLEAGYADMVAVGTGHLCDPAWARKIQAGEATIQFIKCRECLWFVDGMKCPVVRKRQEK